jgi:hypothetical protein
MRLNAVTLQAPAGRIGDLTDFYCARLGLGGLAGGLAPAGQTVQLSGAMVRVGWTELRFEAAPDGAAPFYHFACLVPADRLWEALEWAIVTQRLELLPLSEDRNDLLMHFSGWEADACYFHDPVGNIVELIAHAGMGVSGAGGPFRASELLGLSEIGLVGDPARTAAVLAADLDLQVFQGSVDGLAFLGTPTAALILATEGWPWLPQGRPAEAWPVEVTVEASADEPRTVVAGIHRVSRGRRGSPG